MGSEQTCERSQFIEVVASCEFGWPGLMRLVKKWRTHGPEDTGRFRDIHAFEISTRLRLTGAINDEIARLDEAIGQQLAAIPRAAPCCTACGVRGGGHAPGCAEEGTALLSLAGRLDEITGIGQCNARVVIAELGTDPSPFPPPGHAAAWPRLTPRPMQSGETARPGRTGQGNRYIRG